MTSRPNNKAPDSSNHGVRIDRNRYTSNENGNGNGKGEGGSKLKGRWPPSSQGNNPPETSGAAPTAKRERSPDVEEVPSDCGHVRDSDSSSGPDFKRAKIQEES
jgi:hypothetical protein